MDKVLKLFPFITQSKSEEFHEFTKLNEFKNSSPNSTTPKEWVEVNYKSYPKFNKINLPEPKSLKTKSLEDVLRNRRSNRSFGKKAVKLIDLATLLYYSAGLKIKNKNQENRFYPSAGSRYPLELYILINNVEGLKQGVYHYNVKSHTLEFLWVFNYKEVEKIFNQEGIMKSPYILLITSVFWRNQIKYGVRGYRHVLTENGALTQNLYLVSTALNLGCCSFGGFLDKKVNELLGLEFSEETVLSVLAGGNLLY